MLKISTLTPFTLLALALGCAHPNDRPTTPGSGTTNDIAPSVPGSSDSTPPLDDTGSGTTGPDTGAGTPGTTLPGTPGPGSSTGPSPGAPGAGPVPGAAPR